MSNTKNFQSTMARGSDSNYASVTRHRRAFSTSGRPVVLDMIDDDWAADRLEPDSLEISSHEAAVAPLLEEGELDADAIVVSPTGNSSSAANIASERRRRDEGWNDLGLDQIDAGNRGSTAPPAEATAQATQATVPAAPSE